jgi:hypothetical protein
MTAAAIVACGLASGKDARPSQDPSPADSSATRREVAASPSFAGLSPIVSAALAPDLATTCDTVAALFRTPVSREDGRFTDSFRAVERIGCRLISMDSSSREADPTTENGGLESALKRRGWSQDLRLLGRRRR